MPLYGKVVVTDLDGNVYTVGSEERGFRVSLWYGEASTFTMLVSDPDGTFRGRYEAGGKVEVYIDSSDPPTARKFRGVLECPRVQIASPQRLLTLEATDYFYERILGRIVAEVYHEQKAGVIARDLFAKYLPEFNIANVQDTDYTVESKVFPHVSLKEALDWLAKTSGCQYFCDANLNVYFFPRRTRSTGLTVTESMVAAVPESARNLRPVKNSVLVVGGFRLEIDQEQSTVDVNYVTLDVKHYAVKFTPGQIFGKQIQLHLAKVGSPEDLLVRIVEDKSGEPMGPEVANLFFSKGFVDSKTWYPVQARYDFDTAKSYWIVITKVGDASNHYRVYKATDSPAAAVKESDDGTTWTDPSPAYTLAFRTQYGEPV
ncbi:MAG: hypothetical protein ACE5PO_05325, partial [Candidatus Bathyarchaeia archaeon]